MNTEPTPELQAQIEAALAKIEAAKQPKPTPPEHPQAPQGWPALGEHFRAALETACDAFEGNRNLAEAVAWFYARERQEPQLAADLRAWRHDEHGTRRDWAMPIIESGLIAGLIQSTHWRRDRKRGKIVSNLPDAALTLVEEVR